MTGEGLYRCVGVNTRALGGGGYLHKQNVVLARREGNGCQILMATLTYIHFDELLANESGCRVLPCDFRGKDMMGEVMYWWCLCKHSCRLNWEEVSRWVDDMPV